MYVGEQVRGKPPCLKMLHQVATEMWSIDVTSDVSAKRRLQMHMKHHFRPLQERASEMATEKEAVPRSDLNSQDTKGRECGTPSGRWTCRVWLVPEEMFFHRGAEPEEGSNLDSCFKLEPVWAWPAYGSSPATLTGW